MFDMQLLLDLEERPRSTREVFATRRKATPRWKCSFFSFCRYHRLVTCTINVSECSKQLRNPCATSAVLFESAVQNVFPSVVPFLSSFYNEVRQRLLAIQFSNLWSRNTRHAFQLCTQRAPFYVFVCPLHNNTCFHEKETLFKMSLLPSAFPGHFISTFFRHIFF